MSSLGRTWILALAVTTLPVFAHAEPAPATPKGDTVREIEIVVDGAYKPNRITVAKGERVRLVFVRRDYGGCTRDVVFPTLNLKREVPSDKRTVIDLPALDVGEHPFHCSMKMVKGTLVVTGS